MKIIHSSPLCVLCLFSLILATSSTTLLPPAALELSNSRNTQETVITGRRPKPDKEGVYNVSKDLCWGCIGESFQYLFAHNWIRAQKWEMPLIWDSQLEKYARSWAIQRKSDCNLRHSFPEGNFKLGENIYWGSGTTWEPMDAVNAWAGEEKFYSYATNTCQAGKECGHYTQIVWRNTRRIGCARVECDDGDVFMNCNYGPPGNIIGERPY
ncbi:pathogenesis-related protein 1C-like [Papaver somniferum]|uniref:pathogenesis-related protein 1C-like n=1 Tax=Papaver somniferum TaxID=3469 RepID=UPI000E70146E|nr:pathogenesis-related protein 1C-like [Papaver somniferum]